MDECLQSLLRIEALLEQIEQKIDVQAKVTELEQRVRDLLEVVGLPPGEVQEIANRIKAEREKLASKVEENQ